jgi:hypothetical protein
MLLNAPLLNDLYGTPDLRLNVLGHHYLPERPFSQEFKESVPFMNVLDLFETLEILEAQDSPVRELCKFFVIMDNGRRIVVVCLSL